jgi:hypothetical protein
MSTDGSGDGSARWIASGKRICCAVLGLAILPAAASAGSLSEDLAAAQKSLASQDIESAVEFVEMAEAAAANLDSVAVPGIAGKVHYYKGMALYMDGDQDGAMGEWRTALMVDNELQWDEAIAKDGQAQDLFEALRKEVRDRVQVDAAVPPLLGLAKLYVDGERVCPGQTVREGTHLIQVDCPDDRIYGEWVAFPKRKLKWLKLCPNGVDTTLIPEPEEPAEEDMFSFDDALGGESEGCPLPGEEPDEAVVADIPSEPLSAPDGPAPLIEHRVAWPMVALGGGLLVSGGAALAVASSRRSGFESEYENFTSVSQVETRASEVNRVAWVGTGLSVVGGGLCVAAVIPW